MDQNQRDFQNKIIVLSIIFSLVTGFVAGGLSSDLFNKIDFNKLLGLTDGAQIINQQNGVQIVTREEQVVKVVKSASPAVVSVIVSKNVSVGGRRFSPFSGTPFEDFFGQFEIPQSGVQKQQIGGGSGFIISADGLILTNKHVVEDEDADYSVLTNDGREYSAKVLARDPVQDIAVIKVDENNLPTLTFGDSDKVEVGQIAIAIGNALAEFRNTVSVGVISGLGRSVSASSGFGAPAEQLQDVIQTDAAINPGNSGGPLLNSSGQVIGINVAIAQGAQNIGFALPINAAKRDIDQIKKTGKIMYPYLGVRYVLITPEIMQQNNLSVDYGALILRGQNANETAIVSGGPAEKAGLKENDIILEIDGQKIDSDQPLAKIIQDHNVGDAITLKVLSDGKEKTVEVVLEERK